MAQSTRGIPNQVFLMLALRDLVQEHPEATARQIFYLAVRHGLIEHNEAGYDKLCRLLDVERADQQQPDTHDQWRSFNDDGV